MRSIFHYVFVCFVGCLCMSSQIWAAPPSDIREEQLARDKYFLQKALAGKLDCACWRAFKTDHLCALNFDQAFLHRI